MEVFNKEQAESILNSINNAVSMEVLKFVGEVIRVHKQLGKITEDEHGDFLLRCRMAYKSKQEELNGRGIRQQHDGDYLREPEEAGAEESRLHRPMRDRGQEVFREWVDQGEA